MNPVSRSFWAGLFHGALVGAIYCLVEFAFLYLIPFLLDPSGAALTSWDWAFTIASFGIYAGVGALLGALLGLVLVTFGRSRDFGAGLEGANFLQAAVTLLFVVPIAAQFLIRSLRSPLTRVSLAACFVILLGLAVSAFTGARRRWVSSIFNPWTAFFVALGVPWWWQAQWSGTTSKSLAFFCLLALVVLATVLSDRLRPADDSPAPASPGRLAIAAAAVGAVFAALGLTLAITHRGAMVAVDRSPAAPSGKPNVLLIVLDTVRGDHTSLNGYTRNTTPHLKELAQTSTVFSKAIATSNYTLPTHASLFTGLHPRRHGAHRDGSVQRSLDASFETLAEILAKKGFATVGVCANSAMVTPDFGLDQGFHLFKVHQVVVPAPYLRHIVQKGFELTGVRYFARQYLTAQDINDEALPIMEKLAQSDRPFFLFLNYMDSHDPIVIPRGFAAPYANGHPLLSLPQTNRIIHGAAEMTHKPTKDEIAAVTADYDGALTYMDSHVGQILQQLERSGKMDNTLIIVTADHGEGLGEKLVFGHGVSAHQNQVSVPFLIRYPQQKQQQQVSAPVSQIDVLPTVLDVLGLAPLAGIDGLSLRTPAGTGERSVITVAFPKTSEPKALKRYGKGVQAVFSGSLKFSAYGTGERELFDLATDPGEENNLFSKNTAEAKQLAAALDQWLQKTPKYAGKAKKANEQMLERLKGLGYVQ